MFNRSGAWRLFWTVLAVIWTLVLVAYGWLNLPRARHIPHEPQFMSSLSSEALAIVRGDYAPAKPARGEWSEVPRIVRMANGARLSFPATTTDARAAVVAGEYNQLLQTEAEQQRTPYLLVVLVVWLVPLLGTGTALLLFRRGRGAGQLMPDNLRPRTEYSPAEGDHQLHEGPPGKVA
ncbi:MAG: hypothetical protein ABIS45_15650 [Burkholderiales bacterium]